MLLALNILEAVAVDLAALRAPQGLNAVAGILLVVTLPREPRVTRMGEAGRFKDLHYQGLSRGWIIGFTLWNWTFLYLNYPMLAGHHIAVLGTALAVGLVDPARWLWARMFTLATDLLLLATFGEFLLPRMDTSDWSDPSLEIAVAGMTLIVGTAIVHDTGAESSVVSGRN